MTRRRQKTTRPAAAGWLRWKPSFAELFDLAGSDWTPPREVKVQPTVRGSTWTAQFTRPQGDRPTVIVRMRHGWDPITDGEVVDRRVKFSWRMTGAQLRAAHNPESEEALP